MPPSHAIALPHGRSARKFNAPEKIDAGYEHERACRDSNPSPRLRRPQCYPGYTTGPNAEKSGLTRVSPGMELQFLSNSVYPQRPQALRSLWTAMKTPGPHLGQTGLILTSLSPSTL